ncbi:MAG: class I SAM-dependent methyltransferase [Rhodoglobus sp.]
MSIHHPAMESATFGAGGADPYDRALEGAPDALTLVNASSASASPATSEIDIGRFLRQADDADLTVVRRAQGPVLDVGCGPGRMVKAAILAGHLALGVDVSGAAVALARDKGLPVLRRSVFETLPSEGAWGTVLLLDGNIGIGGNPGALLDRCASLVAPGGRILVETHSESRRDRSFDAVVIDGRGRRSLKFPWAEVGIQALKRHANQTGLRVGQEWQSGDRTFAEYVRS